MKRNRDKAFLAWCHTQDGACCLCRLVPWTDLHHWGSAGMGMRGDDRKVARVCRHCHARYGRREHALRRNGEVNVLDAYQRDARELGERYDRG